MNVVIRKIFPAILVLGIFGARMSYATKLSGRQKDFSLDTALPVVRNIAGDPIRVEDAIEYFLFRIGDKGGQILKTNLPEENKNHKIEPSDDLFGHIAGTENKNEFTFVAEVCPIEILRDFLKYKVKELCDRGITEKVEDYSILMFSESDHFKGLDYEAKRNKIDDILNLNFIKTLEDISKNIKNEYGDNWWPIDLKDFNDLYNHIHSLSKLIGPFSNPQFACLLFDLNRLNQVLSLLLRRNLGFEFNGQKFRIEHRPTKSFSLSFSTIETQTEEEIRFAIDIKDSDLSELKKYYLTIDKAKIEDLIKNADLRKGKAIEWSPEGAPPLTICVSMENNLNSRRFGDFQLRFYKTENLAKMTMPCL